MNNFENYFINKNTSTQNALWKLISVPEKLLFITDDNQSILGFINIENFPPYSEKLSNTTIKEICRKDVNFVYQDNAYMYARNIMAEYPSISIVPVVDSNQKPVGILRRWQCFFKDQYYKSVRTSEPIEIPYPYYAVAIWRAAEVSQAVGIKSFSVLEFGVGTGNGLISCELLAKEISSIFNVDIRVYGFDRGEGLPSPHGWRDVPQCWNTGLFQMDQEKLLKNLSSATLILGDLEETLPKFSVHSYSPIGVMLVDVDYYSSTLPVLSILEGDSNHFLPIVNMYFDDIGASLESQGETLAIREFNSKNKMRKISPEFESFGEYNLYGRRYGFSKLKSCLLFDHELFSVNGFTKKILHDFWR